MTDADNRSVDPFVYITVLNRYYEITVSLNILSMITHKRGRGVARKYCGCQSHDGHVANV
jgi:hypothetical protein